MSPAKYNKKKENTFHKFSVFFSSFFFFIQFSVSEHVKHEAYIINESFSS